MKALIPILFLLPGAALAQAQSPDPEPPRGGAYAPMQGVEYYCTDNSGNRAEIGAVMCFTASCLTWTARCEMNANNNFAMWRKMQDGCPGASLFERIERLQPGGDTGAVHAQI
jgi:hypothetical protein